METKKSKIELLIDEIEDYINSCKYKTLSNSIILVNKDEIESFLLELKKNTPDEIKHYQKIIANRNAIIAEADKVRNDAKLEAQDIVNKAINETNSLVSEHEIMQRAYDQANEIINLAAQQAQEIVDAATIEANSLRDQATQYTDSLLEHVEVVTSKYISDSTSEFTALLNSLTECVNIVKGNRAELYPQPVAPAMPEPGMRTDYIPVQNTATMNTGAINAAALRTDSLQDSNLL